MNQENPSSSGIPPNKLRDDIGSKAQGRPSSDNQDQFSESSEPVSPQDYYPKKIGQKAYFMLQPEEDIKKEVGSPMTSLNIGQNNGNPEQSPKRSLVLINVMLFLMVVFGLAIIFVLILLAMFGFAKEEVRLKPLNGAMETIYHNLNKDPILDVDLVRHKEGCPRNFEKVIIGTWPGTVKGCKCPGESVERSPCHLKNKDTCFYIEKLNPIELYDWQESSICVRRAIPEREYVQHPICPSGFKECSSGFCFLDSLECPITSLIISENDSGSVGVFSKGTSSRYLVPLRSQGKSPLVDFAITPNDLPCFSSGEVPVGLTEPYALLREINGCNSYGADTEWSFPIEEQAQDEILSNNEVEPYLTSVLPEYANVIHNTKVVLSGRIRITVANKKECQSLDKELLATSPSYEYGRVKDCLLWIAIISGIFHFTLVVLLVLFVLLETKLGNKWQTTVRSKDFKEGLEVILLFTCVELTGLIFVFTKFSEPYSVLMKSAQYFQTLNQIGCFPVAQPSQVFEDFSIRVHEVATPLYTYSLLLIVLNICIAISATVTICKVRKLRNGN